MSKLSGFSTYIEIGYVFVDRFSAFGAPISWCPYDETEELYLVTHHMICYKGWPPKALLRVISQRPLQMKLTARSCWFPREPISYLHVIVRRDLMSAQGANFFSSAARVQHCLLTKADSYS